MSEASSTNIVYVKYFLIGNIDTNTTITEYSTNALGSKEKKMQIRYFREYANQMKEDMKKET